MIRWVLAGMVAVMSSVAWADWSRNVRQSPMDGVQTLTLSVRAAETIAGMFGRPVRPALVIVCSKGEVDVYAATEMVLSEDADKVRVRVRFDSEEAEAATGTRSTDYTAVFFDYSKRMMGKLRKANALLVEFTPHGESKRIARFVVSGLGKHEALIAKHCQL